MIRALRKEDIHGCILVVDDVWKFSEIFHPEQLAEIFLELYTLGSLSDSNFNFVVEENNSIVGFIFGKTKNGELYKTKYSGLMGQFRIIFNLFRINGVSLKNKFEYLKMMNIHELNRFNAEPDRKYEVNLFAVSEKMQGRGVGKKLMNVFIDKCKCDGVKRITLDTDEECNYKFYEHFGYKKIAEFYSPIQMLYTNKSGNSYVYELKIV
jgi:ribosomal protein S18 acetylase RimI-like enzyme